MFHHQVIQLAEQLRATGKMLAVAESCTGGWLAKVCTDVAGSSHWFERGFVTYSNQAKSELLAVPSQLIESQGAVSEAVVEAMLLGVLAHSPADLAVAISGIAGPDGGSTEKPVGTVFIGWAQRNQGIQVTRFRFDGDRDAVRAQSVEAALDGLLNRME